MKLLGLSFRLCSARALVRLSTERHVHGVITAVDPAIVTISSSQRTVSGKIDPARTKVTIHGKRGHARRPEGHRPREGRALPRRRVGLDRHPLTFGSR